MDDDQVIAQVIVVEIILIVTLKTTTHWVDAAMDSMKDEIRSISCFHNYNNILIRILLHDNLMISCTVNHFRHDGS